MTNEVKVAITNAVFDVYDNTNGDDVRRECSKEVGFVYPSTLGECFKQVFISRVRDSDGWYYKLYINSISQPFMTVFGFWPIGFVSDIFIKTLEHYYDWY